MDIDTITSLNLRGLNNPVRARLKLTSLKKLNSKIIVLQETKLRKNVKFDWQYVLSEYVVYESRNLASCLGMAILIRKDISIKYGIKVERHNNRIMSVLMYDEKTNREIRIYNVHAPILTDPRKRFFRYLKQLIDNDTNYCILGDWNVANEHKEKVFANFINEIGV